MLDITKIEDGKDLMVMDEAVSKAANVLSVQLATLEYAPTFGVDLRYFLESKLQFQNESFRAYLIQRLAEHQINVGQVIETLETFSQKYTFSVGGSQETGGLII